MNNKIINNCVTCGDSFEVWPYQKDRIFCSRKCRRHSDNTKDKISETKKNNKDSVGEKNPGYIDGGTIKICFVCGKEFNIPTSTKKQRKFCSRKCKGIWMSENLINESNSNWIDGRSKNEKYKKEYNRKWIENNREYKNYLNLRRQAIKKNAEGSHTFNEWQELKKEYNYICPACGKQESEIKLTEDHIIPLSNGGSDYIDNIQPLCRSCNCKKYIKTIVYPILTCQKYQ